MSSRCVTSSAFFVSGCPGGFSRKSDDGMLENISLPFCSPVPKMPNSVHMPEVLRGVQRYSCTEFFIHADASIICSSASDRGV